MSKFCPECANPIIDSNATFCPKCGTKLPSNSPASQPPATQQPAVQQPPEQKGNFVTEFGKPGTEFLNYIESKTKTFVEKNGPSISNRIENSPSTDTKAIGNIIGGILIILLLYIFPVNSVGGRNFSIADLTSICDSLLGMALGGSNCNMWKLFFYGGWAIGIVCVIWGVVVYLKKK